MATIKLVSIDFDSTVDDLLLQRGTINTVFDDNSMVEIPIRKLILHLIFWKVARKWGVTITPDFLVETDSINADTLSAIGTKILSAARKIHSVYHSIVFDFDAAMNRLNRFVIDNCQEYHKSLSILDLAHISDIPEIKLICDDKVMDPEMSMKDARRHIKGNIKRLYAELKKPHPHNAIANFINLRFVKDIQLAHIFYQIGYRTDIDDTIIRYPVQGNYLNGLKNVTEFCLEALSAKKSAFYNKDSLPNTEYFGRRQHILLSSIKHMFPGDCGTDVTIPLLVTPKMREVVLYKNIVDGALLISLDESNIDRYVGKVVNFRTPMACRHRNGICEACGGKLLSSITPNTHIGIFSAIQTTSVVTQVILSAKHMQDTNSVDYVLPTEINTIMVKTLGNIFVKPKLADKFKESTLVFATKDAVHLMGLSDFNMSRVSSINETMFGVCNEMVILRNNVLVGDQVCMNVNGQTPMYSKHLIKYIADHPEHIIIRDDMFMIVMRDFDFNNPIFKLRTMNNSMVKFVGNAKKLLEISIQSYTSATELLNDFANLVYEQVRPNIVYLEVVLRAAMITSKYDYRLPVVTDINDIKFMSNKLVNMNRSLGMLCAFQQLPEAVSDPAYYLSPKSYVPFDDFLNLKLKDERRSKDRRTIKI